MNEYEYPAVQVEPPYQEGMNRIRALCGVQVYDTLSQVCSRWAIAINNSPFWQSLTPYVYGGDPRMWDSLVHMWFTNGIERVMTRDHFVHARATVCGVCIAYSPRVHFALSGASTWTVAGGRVSLCKYHDQNGFCGMCFKDENVLRSAVDQHQQPLSVSSSPDNNNQQQYYSLNAVHETDTYFGKLRHTCERCRVMATRNLMRHHKLNSHILRSTDMDELFHTYQVLGEGSLFSLVFQVHERRWLLTNTKIKDFSFQAIASDRVIRGMPMAEAMMMNSSDPEDSYILYNEPSVRELAVRDFMRTCVLGGLWFAPNDVSNLSNQQSQYLTSYWHNGQPTNFDVVHPTRGERRSITWYYPVPTQEIKATLQSLWFQTMIEILETAFKNIIAEVLDGCLVDSKVWEFENGGETAPGSISDPGPQLQSWSMQNVWDRLLRSEYWVTGYNWRTRKLDEHRARRISDASSSFSLSKSSSTSVESVTQSSESPTGTTSTMQTSPSPPPPNNGQPKDVKPQEPISMTADVEVHKATVSPVLQIPDLPDIELTGAQARLVQSVPFVPVTWVILPQESVRCISQLWIKTIHPFVACQCGICKRACQMQEEERLRGSPKKRPTAGIVINEPRHHHDSDDIFDDEDYDDDLDSNDDDFEANIMAMDSDPMDEEVGIVDTLHTAEQTTPVQLIQQPATPPETLTPELSPTTGRAQPRLAKIEQPPVGSLSPPTWRKRASQELESAPSSPSSAVKRRRLDSESSTNKVESPSVYSSDPREPQSHSESATTFSPSEADADPNLPPESSPPESVNSPVPRVQTPNPPSSNNKGGGTTPLHPAGFEEVTGIHAPNESVGISLLDFSLDEDLTESGLLSQAQADGEQAPQNNTAMQWEQQ